MRKPYTEIASAVAHDELATYRVIDVREEHEFHGPLGFIEGAELVPLSTVSDSVAQLDAGQALLLVCRSGMRSGKACEILREVGVKDVTNLVGGMIGWNGAGLPVRYSDPKSLTGLLDQIVSWFSQVGPLTTEAALQVVHNQLERLGVRYEEPSHVAIDEVISFVGESLEPVNPPDLGVSLDSFRRWLAVL